MHCSFSLLGCRASTYRSPWRGPDCTVSIKADTTKIQRAEATRQGDVGQETEGEIRRGSKMILLRIGFLTPHLWGGRRDAKSKRTFFNSVCERSMWLLTFVRYFPNILLWEFSNLRQSWNHFIANTHLPTPCILLLGFYYACFIPDLSICPSLYPSISSCFWCISK